MLISYLDSLNTLKIISVSDLLFFVFSNIIMILTGSYLTYNKRINLSFSRMYIITTIYSLILFMILMFSLKETRMLNVDDTIFSSSFSLNFVSLKFAFLLVFFSLVFLTNTYSYIAKKLIRTTFEYPLIIHMSILGMFLLLFTNDLFVWFLAIELQSFCFYALAAYRTNRSFLQTEAGLKYFLFGSIASSLYLFGISIFYLQFGTLQWDSIIALSYFPLQNPIAFQVALLFIFTSLFFKLGIAPFHFWLPTVYTYTSSIITYLFILLPKIPLFYLLWQFSPLTYNYILYFPLILSLCIGTLFALKSTNIKTFFAYSAIANSAFFLAPMLAQSTASLYSFLFYLFTYNILITIAFLPILFLKRADLTHAFSNLRDLIILKKTNPLLALFYSAMILSMSGIPPLVGFFSKLFILLSAISSATYVTVMFLLAFSILSAFYYLRLVKITYFSFHLKSAFTIAFPIIPAYTIVTFSTANIFFLTFPSYFAVFLNLL